MGQSVRVEHRSRRAEGAPRQASIAALSGRIVTMDTVETPSPVDRLTITGAPSGDASEDPATSLLALP